MKLRVRLPNEEVKERCGVELRWKYEVGRYLREDIFEREGDKVTWKLFVFGHPLQQ